LVPHNYSTIEGKKHFVEKTKKNQKRKKKKNNNCFPSFSFFFPKFEKDNGERDSA